MVELVIGAEAVFAVEHQKRNTGRRHLTALEGPPQLPAHRDHVMVAVRGIDGAEDEALGGAARRVAFASMPARPCRSASALRKVRPPLIARRAGRPRTSVLRSAVTGGRGWDAACAAQAQAHGARARTSAAAAARALPLMGGYVAPARPAGHARRSLRGFDLTGSSRPGSPARRRWPVPTRRPRRRTGRTSSWRRGSRCV